MFDRKLSRERLLVGIGGNSGVGKTTVAGELKRYGAKIIEADTLGWALLAKGTPQHKALLKEFGREILTKTGNIDRKALGSKAFASRANLTKLNKITHPALIARVRKEIDRHKKGLVIVDAALLFLWGLDKDMDIAILVTAPERLKIKRLRDTGLSEEQVSQRLKLQESDTKVWRRADFVLENSGSFAELKRKSRALWNFFYSNRYKTKPEQT